MLADLNIISPKRSAKANTEWERFFPYYAGFPDAFASAILRTSKLASDALIVDPWNGSGTTTCAASRLGYSTVGFDLNPAMVVIGRARLLPPTEANSIEPLSKKVIESARRNSVKLDAGEPLLNWFGPRTAEAIRSLEGSIRSHLVGPTSGKMENLSGLAATFYVALFSVCRSAAAAFQSSNPTWFRRAKQGERRTSIERPRLEKLFLEFIARLTHALRKKLATSSVSKVIWADSAKSNLEGESVDMILTSPPYCTRIDYTAATRIELAILAPILECNTDKLRAQMLGSINVPKTPIVIQEAWGQACVSFLGALRSHSSRASESYYHKTHLDYFQKLFRSMVFMSNSLRIGGSAIMVVQDSYYKELHNDLAEIVTQMGTSTNLVLRRREDFHSQRSMSGINTRSRLYNRPRGATESVLCFEKLRGARDL